MRGISDNIVEEDQASTGPVCLDYKFPSAVKNKSNSLPKSAFSNIQLRVQEIRDQLEVLKQSSNVSGSKALQQVFPRMRPPSLTSQPGQTGRKTELSARPGFLNNRPLSMPSPPLASSPHHSPNSMSPRSLSPNPTSSPKHNIRTSSCYQGGAGARMVSPPSSPSTLSPCSSASLTSYQGGITVKLYSEN